MGLPLRDSPVKVISVDFPGAAASGSEELSGGGGSGRRRCARALAVVKASTTNGTSEMNRARLGDIAWRRTHVFPRTSRRALHEAEVVGEPPEIGQDGLRQIGV